MSKSSKKNGKLLYTLYQSVEANPKPTPRVLALWKKLDTLAQLEFKKPYDALDDNQKVQLHFNINVGAYKTEKG